MTAVTSVDFSLTSMTFYVAIPLYDKNETNKSNSFKQTVPFIGFILL